MTQKVSIIDLTGETPLTQCFLSSNTENEIGDEYCKKHNLIVLENSADEIRIALSRENLSCIDELKKTLPKEKRIKAMLVGKTDILRLMIRAEDLFGMNYCH
jgi:hypothetical protein